MPNYNKLVLTAADYKVVLAIPGRGAYPLLTVESIDSNVAQEDELVYAVGETDAIANKRNAKKVTGKINMQVGEISVLLQAAGLVDATQIEGATLAITAIIGGFARTYSSININTESISVKAKDKQTMVDLDFAALSVN